MTTDGVFCLGLVIFTFFGVMALHFKPWPKVNKTKTLYWDGRSYLSFFVVTNKQWSLHEPISLFHFTGDGNLIAKVGERTVFNETSKDKEWRKSTPFQYSSDVSYQVMRKLEALHAFRVVFIICLNSVIYCNIITSA